MDDGTVDVDPDLTSTISDVLLSTKNDKTDANDSTPTSSTDAASSFLGTSLTVSEDPISSTSSDVMERDKLSSIKNENNEKETVSPKNLLGADGDVDLLDMNIQNVSSELISEDVEDIVQDLENLLGEPEPHHDFPTRRKEKSPVEETELLASLDVQLSGNIDSNQSPLTSNTQVPEKIEIDEDVGPIKDQTSTAEESSITIEQTSSEEKPVILETQKGEEKPEIEEVNCQSDKLEVPTSGQLEEEIGKEATKETPEDKPEEHEVNAVSSSETVSVSQVLPHSVDENFESKVIEEADKVEQSKDSGDGDEELNEKIINDSENLKEDKISENPHLKANIATPEEKEEVNLVSENCIETGGEELISEVVIEDDQQAELVEIEEELQYFVTDPSEEVITCDPSDEVVTSDPSAEILITEIMDDETSVVESICANEEVIQEAADSVPEMLDTSIVTTDSNLDIPKTDVESDVNVTSSSDPSADLEQQETPDCSTTESIQESNEANPEVSKEISECEELLEPENPDIVLNDQIVASEEITNYNQANAGDQIIESGIQAVKQVTKQENPNASDENSRNDCADAVSEEKSEVVSEDIKQTVMENQVTCEEPSTPKDEEKQILSSPLETLSPEEKTVETIGKEPENLEDLTEVAEENKLVTLSDESLVEEQTIADEDISSGEKEETDDLSSTKQNVQLVEDKLEVLCEAAISKQEIPEENLELHLSEGSNAEQMSNQEIVKEQIVDESVVQNSVQSPPDETIEQESTQTSEMISVSNDVTSDCKDNEKEKMVPTVPEDQKDEITTNEDVAEIRDDEVMAEIERKQESLNPENSPATIEIIEKIVAESTEPVEENSVLSQENKESIGESSEASGHFEENIADQIKADFSSEVSSPEESIVQCETENIETSETENDIKKQDLDIPSVDQLVPVNEEICVEKVIIYEHDCDAHKTQGNIEIKDEQEDSNTKHTTEKSNEELSILRIEALEEEIIQAEEDSSNSTKQQSNAESETSPVQNTEVVVDEVIETPVNSLISEQLKSDDPKTEMVVETIQSRVEQQQSSDPRPEVTFEEAVQSQVDSSSPAQQQSSTQSEIPPDQTTESDVHETVQSPIDSLSSAQQQSSAQSESSPVQRTESDIHEAIQSQVDSLSSAQQQPSVQSENSPVQETQVIQHPVDSSLPDQHNSTAESENTIVQTTEIIEEKIQLPIDSSESKKEQPAAEFVDQNEPFLNNSEVTRSEDAKIDEIVEDMKENLDVKEQQETVAVESIIPEENENSNQTPDVSSSEQQNLVDEKGESEMSSPPNTTISIDSVLKPPIEQVAEETNSGAIVEQTIEDQTSAAVQSILENMLTEEKHIEKIIEKEETPVVHSSYSSYEVQKAVQEIQGIGQMEEVVEMPAEEIPDISSSEKPSDSETVKYESGSFEAMHVDDRNVAVESEIAESKSAEVSFSPVTENIALENIAPVVSEEVFDEKLETVQVEGHKNNQESVIESSNSDQGQAVEQQSPIQSKEESSSETVQHSEPVVMPSLDLSEESSSEEGSDEDKKQNIVSSSTYDHKDIKIISKNVPKVEKVSCNVLTKAESKKHSPREIRHSSRISEKIKPHNLKEDMVQPLSVNIDEVEREKPYSPKITIKPIKEDEPSEDKEEHKGSLKITITKQSDNTHSILKMCSPDRSKQSENDEQNVVPKLVIKTSDAYSDQHSPKMSTRSSKQALPTNSNIRSGSPRITIKPIVKPDAKETITSPLKITIKPIGKPEEFSRQQQRHSPKQIKSKTDDDHYSTRSKMMKSSENSDVHSPKVTIKPVKPPEDSEMVSTPKITIKPIEKPEEARVSPKITIKPVVRPVELETEVEDEVKERIVLKINKGNLPAKDTERISRESRKRELEEDKSEKLAKIKLKFSKDGDAHIVHKKETETQSFNKRQHDYEMERSKRFKADATDSDEDVKLIETRQSPIVISEDSQSQDSVIIIEDAKDPLADVPIPKPQLTPVSAPRKRGRPRKVPLVVREEFTNEPKVIQATPTPISVLTPEQPTETESTGRPKRSCRAQSVRDTLGIKPRKPSKPRGGKRGAGAKSISFKPEKEPGFSEEKIDALKKSFLTDDAVQAAHCSGILKVSCESSPKKEVSKKEEPIKPLGLKSLLEAAKDQNIIEVIEIDTPSNSPKSAEPCGVDKIEEECVVEEEALGKIDNTDKSIESSDNITGIKNFEIQKEVLDSRDDADCNKEASDFGGTDAAASDVEMQPPTPVFAPPLSESLAIDISSTTDIAMFEEETRMSADASSRAQTPAKQVVSSDVVVEESQSSIQSTATTESGKISRRSRLEVHQDQDGSVFTADQLNEYYWGGNGPFMIQEQVAQFLGIKSFKRKYPGIPRRMVDMQERDYIRENGLASESMCDLGLTAVNSVDILDIMYTDFQEKYEEFCRIQRDKQAKDLLNKQRALSLAANQEKSKLDILEQAVQSAAAYNANFNKTRREQRRACMDLQTMNIHYPKGKLKKINMPKIGHYPVAVVPGQFTDYYKEFTPTELNNLPLNTMLYTELFKILPEVSDSDSESSGSDSDDSSSSGSESNSSCEENCKMCEKSSITPRKSPVNSTI